MSSIRVQYPFSRFLSCIHAVGKLVPGLFPVGENFPKHDAKAPDVALCGELPIHDAFRWHPANGKHGPASHLTGRRVSVLHAVSAIHNDDCTHKLVFCD